MRTLISVSIVGMVIVPFIAAARAQAPAPSAFGSRVLADNDRVRIQRLTVPAGAGPGYRVPQVPGQPCTQARA